jgi:hypothetical protein
MKHEPPYFFAKTFRQNFVINAIAMGRSLAVAMPTPYSRPEFLNTSESIEFMLDFSTGVKACR